MERVKQTELCIEKHRDRERNRPLENNIEREIERKADTETNGQRDRETCQSKKPPFCV